MTTLLADVATVATTLIDVAGDIITFIVANPLLLVFFCIAIVFKGIGLFQAVR